MPRARRISVSPGSFPGGKSSSHLCFPRSRPVLQANEALRELAGLRGVPALEGDVAADDDYARGVDL